MNMIRIALWGPLTLAALLLAIYIYVHRPLAQDGTELLQVPLSDVDPELNQVGQLKYLGGLDIPRMDQDIGGLSGLRWDEATNRLLAITDDARWVWITPVEERGRLTGIAGIETGNLLGTEGEVLTGKERGDSESLTKSESGAWLVGYERDHRILAYDDLTGPARLSPVDLEADFGPLEANSGLETMAGNDKVQIMCVQRPAADSPARSNCLRRAFGTGIAGFNAAPPRELIEFGAVPTDADTLADGTVLILFRSYSSADGNRAAIVSYSLARQRTEIATLRPPLNTDNFEGLAVREEGGQTYLYLVSDDNFSGSQRTLLMKFEYLKAGS